MATDLITSIQRFITPDVVSRIAAGLGDDKSSVNRAVSAGIPAILAGLAGAADRPEGAQRLANVLHQSSLTLDEITGAVTGTEQRSIADHGASVLSTLLGDDTMKSLTSAVAGYAGASPASGKSILGLLAPIVLGVLGQRQRAAALDAGGLASLLAAQKNAIADALPQGFAGQLAKSGLLDSLGLDVRGAGLRSPEVASYAKNPPSVQSSGVSPWALAAVALMAVAGVYWLMSGPQDEELAQQETLTEGRAVGTPDTSTASVIQRTAASVAGLRSALQDMTVPGQAEAALPRLRDAAAEIDKLTAQAGQMPAAGKKRVAGLVSASMPAINALIDKVLADPAVAAMARPVIDPIRAKLASLTSD